MTFFELIKKELKALKNDSSGQGAANLVVTIGVGLVMVVTFLMIYAQVHAVILTSNYLNPTGAGIATLNLVNATLIPLSLLIFALVGAIAIVLVLANRGNQ